MKGVYTLVCVRWQACGVQGGDSHLILAGEGESRTESLIDLEYTQVNQTAWTVSSRAPPASVSSVLGLKACTSMPNFFCGWQGSNLSPHAPATTSTFSG